MNQPSREDEHRAILFVYGSPEPSFAQALERRGFRLYLAPSRSEAITRAEQTRPSCVVVEMALPGGANLGIVSDLKAITPCSRVVLLANSGSVVSAVEAMRRGAADYLVKPVETERLLAAVEPLGESESAPTIGPKGKRQLPTLEQMQWEYIHTVLGSCGGNVSEAARQLGLYRQSLQRMLRRHPPSR